MRSHEAGPMSQIPAVVSFKLPEKKEFAHEPLSKLLVSPLISPIVVSYIIPYITSLKEFRLQFT